MSAGGRNFGLDTLRAAAILGVFLCHEVGIKVAGAAVFSALVGAIPYFSVCAMLAGFSSIIFSRAVAIFTFDSGEKCPSEA